MGGRCRRFNRARNFVDGLFEVGIVLGEQQRRSVERERVAKVPPPVMNLGHPANGRKILGRMLKHIFQLALRLVEVVELDERTSERDAC